MSGDAGHWEFRVIRCPVCDGEGGRFTGWRGGWAHRRGAGEPTALLRCGGCGLVYPNPMPFPRDTSHYDGEDDYFGPSDTQSKVDHFLGLFEHARELSGRTGRVLDVGCGRGEALVAARQVGWTGVGVDPSERFAAHGRDALGVDVRTGLLEVLDEPPASFDLVLFAGVLEHSYDPLGLLKGARALLVPGGLVYIDVPNESSAYARVGRAAQLLRGRDWGVALSPTFAPYHVVGFSARALRVALERAELAVVTLEHYPLMLSAHAGLGRAAGAAVDRAERLAARVGASAGLLAWGRAR